MFVWVRRVSIVKINNSSIKGHFRPVCHALLLVVCIRGEWQEHVGMRHTHTASHSSQWYNSIVLQWRCQRHGGGFKASLWLGLSVEAKKRPKGPHYDRNSKIMSKNFMPLLPSKSAYFVEKHKMFTQICSSFFQIKRKKRIYGRILSYFDYFWCRNSS